MAETGIKKINGRSIADETAREAAKNSIKYTEQTLTDAQKAQAISNIGAVAKSQGVDNAGKIFGVDDSGNVVPQDKPVQALAGAIAPSTATAGVVGQEYYVIVDNAVTEMYVCTSALIGSYTWDKVEFGGGTDKSLGITSARVGQIAKITAVDAAGKPTGWETFGWETIADIIVEDENIYYYKWDVNNKTEFIMMVSLTPLTNSDKKINGIAGLNAAGTPWDRDAIRITGNIQSVMSTEIGNTYIISGKKTDNKWTPGCFMKSANAGAAHTTLTVGGSWYTTSTGNPNPLSFPEIGEITNIAVGSYTKFFGVGSHIQIIAR